MLAHVRVLRGIRFVEVDVTCLDREAPTSWQVDTEQFSPAAVAEKVRAALDGE